MDNKFDDQMALLFVAAEQRVYDSRNNLTGHAIRVSNGGCVPGAAELALWHEKSAEVPAAKRNANNRQLNIVFSPTENSYSAALFCFFEQHIRMRADKTS
jgi:hypothetical protein